MKLLPIATALAAASMVLVSAQEASAQLTLATPPECDAFNAFVANGSSVSYTACAGAFAGNDANQDVAGWLWTNWGLMATHAGTTDPTDPAGVFSAQFPQGATTGMLNFHGLSGVFVLALKAGQKFSLYQFDTGGDMWTTLTYGTSGTSLNAQGQPQELSHAAVYTTVPEPGTIALLFSGLAAIGFLAWRRREEALA